MSAPATQTQQHEQKKKQSESPGEEALKKNTDCVYFLASPSTCKKGAECEYRHSEYARVNPRDCYYWLSGNCLNPKCGFRHPALGNLGGLPAGSVPTSQAVVKQPFPCVFFQKGMCAKGDMCSYMHTPIVAGFKKQHPLEAKPAADPQFSTEEKKLVAPRVTPALRDSRGVEGYIPKHVGYEPVVKKMDVGVPSLTDENNSFHNGKDGDDGVRESSPGFDVFVDNEARDDEYYHVGDGYGRRSQEGRNSLNEYDSEFSAIAGGGDREGFRDQRFDSYDRRDDRHAWGHRRGSSERGDRLERRVYGENEGSENILASDLRYRLAKQRKGNDYAAPESSMERVYRDSRRNTPRESSISSSSRLQGRIKLRERSSDEEGHFGRRVERGRDRSDLSQSRLRDRINGRLEQDHSGNQERDLRAPWVRRRETEEGFSVSKGSKKEEIKTETSLGKRKSLEEDHHPYKRSGDSFAAPLPFSEILKRKRAAASGGSLENKDQTPEETISEEAGDDETKLITEEKTEAVFEPNPANEAGLEGTIMEEGEEVNGEEEQVYEEEEQAYEGDELNGEYYYEEDGEYAYEEGEEVVYAAEEGEEATEGGEAEGVEDIEKKTAGMLS
ncbi:unnamed protein product [Eruca vesicaria subsp. sativa]|uniref:C3H1-type domain-containing protein n=1 Tax=Eruca vesicaria subsp. sativa TaxID=29727 RepID=A0ABC8M9E6_ERUVS|nr:unnamed protein product [Eruca vesicaria subsp. sativa]